MPTLELKMEDRVIIEAMVERQPQSRFRVDRRQLVTGGDADDS